MVRLRGQIKQNNPEPMEDLVNRLMQINKEFNSNELENGLQYFRIKTFKKGEFLIKPDSHYSNLFYVADGLFESYTHNSEGKIEVYWFEGKGSFITDVNGFILSKPSMTYIEACEDSITFFITKKSLDELCIRFNSWSVWRIRFYETEYLKLFEFFRRFIHSTAGEKYEWLTKTYPDILKKVPLGHIASLMGISQVSLSRVRAGKQTK